MAEKKPANASWERVSSFETSPEGRRCGAVLGRKDVASFLPRSYDQNDKAKMGVTPTIGAPIPR